MILSILIATTYSRNNTLQKLIENINNQISIYNLSSKIELIVVFDEKQVSVGYKRQKLLECASGKYVCYIDSDDNISDTYCKDIVDAIEQNPNSECVGFLIECNMDGKIELAIASNRYSDWCENKNGFRYCRTIYHKTPVRRDIALMVGFEDLRFAEDYKYAVGLKKTGLLKNEIFIDKVLYYYNYKYENPKTKYGL